jgi:hypothetical protein
VSLYEHDDFRRQIVQMDRAPHHVYRFYDGATGWFHRQRVSAGHRRPFKNGLCVRYLGACCLSIDTCGSPPYHRSIVRHAWQETDFHNGFRNLCLWLVPLQHCEERT